jgi:hypothetical protein
MNDILITYAVTVVALVFLRLVMGLVTRGRFSVRSLILGKDGGLSISQLQAAIWTVIVLAAYIAVYTAYFRLGQPTPTIDIPGNLLTLAGLSYATYIGAGAITQNQLEKSYKDQTKITPPAGERLKKSTLNNGSAGDLVNNDENKTDLGKFQLIAWTLIAVFLFLIGMHQHLNDFFAARNGSAVFSFPDIDPNLLALVGLGQGTYLANKVLNDKAVAAVPAHDVAMSVERHEAQVTGGATIVKETTTVAMGGRHADAATPGAPGARRGSGSNRQVRADTRP